MRRVLIVLALMLLALPAFAASIGGGGGIYGPPGDLRSDGTVPMSADLNMGAQVLTNVSTVNFSAGGSIGAPSYASVYASSHTVTINTTDTYTLASDGMILNETSGPSYNATTGGITIQAGGGGVYMAGIFMSFSGGNLATVHCSLFIDGTEDMAVEVERKLSAGGDIGSAGASNIITLADGEVVTFMCKQDTTTTNQVHNHGSFWINRIAN